MEQEEHQRNYKPDHGKRVQYAKREITGHGFEYRVLSTEGST
jgi:hypothetical protein